MGFKWFSLKKPVIDDNGGNVTGKEYIEKVLEGTKNIQIPKKIRKMNKRRF